jgi:uncharacterized protein (DUF302 family)
MTPQGLIKLRSAHGLADTMERVVAAASARRMVVFARVDHAAAAAGAGIALPPTVVVLIGNPRAGTPLMQEVRTIAIDLPLKVLVWQDDGGDIWLAYDEPRWLAARHGIGSDAEPLLTQMTEAMAAVAHEATAVQIGNGKAP